MKQVDAPARRVTRHAVSETHYLGRSTWDVVPETPFSLLGLVTELLPATARFVHQAAFRHREDRHAVLVGAGRRGMVLGRARPRAGPAGRRLCRCARSDGHGARLRAELEGAARELVEGLLVPEKDDLAERLAAQLRAH